MFCPECGTLGFMEPDGNIRCTNYTCGYEGPLTGKDGKGAEFTDPMTCLLYTSPSPRDS